MFGAFCVCSCVVVICVESTQRLSPSKPRPLELLDSYEIMLVIPLGALFLVHMDCKKAHQRNPSLVARPQGMMPMPAVPQHGTQILRVGWAEDAF